MRLDTMKDNWGIYENDPEEVLRYGFHYTLLTPIQTQQESNLGRAFSPADSYLKCANKRVAIDLIDLMQERGYYL